MSSYGYEINTTLQLYKKLLDEREDFLKNPTSSRFAMNCALTGWHLREWIFNEYRSNRIIRDFKNINEFRKYLFKKCDDLKLFRDLADGSKHFLIDKRPFKVTKTEVRPSGSELGFKNILETPTLIISFKISTVGAIVTFDDVLYVVTSFWHEFIKKELESDVDSISDGYSLF